MTSPLTPLSDCAPLGTHARGSVGYYCISAAAARGCEGAATARRVSDAAQPGRVVAARCGACAAASRRVMATASRPNRTLSRQQRLSVFQGGGKGLCLRDPRRGKAGAGRRHPHRRRRVHDQPRTLFFAIGRPCTYTTGSWKNDGTLEGGIVFGSGVCQPGMTSAGESRLPET